MVLALFLTGLALLHGATAQQDIPFCLQACLTQVGTNLCADHALHDLTPCLSTGCPNPPATQNLIASLDVAFTPKAEYSCQQAYGPVDADKESSSVTLPLNGTCATSPYVFKSFLPLGVSRIRASNGCRVMTFSDEDCLGETAGSDVSDLSNGQCVFRGGRSARLTCRNELDAARAYIQTSCGKDDDDDELTDLPSSSSTFYPSSAPYHGPGPTSPGTGTSSSIPYHWPFSSDTAIATGTALPDTADATGTALTNTADATGTSLPSISSNNTTQTLTYPSASATAPSNGSSSGNSTASNGTQTSISSPDSQNATGVLTLTLSGTPSASSTSLPHYVGLAAGIGGGTQMGVALGLAGAGFVAFL